MSPAETQGTAETQGPPEADGGGEAVGDGWQEANQSYLVARVDRLRSLLEEHLAGLGEDPKPGEPGEPGGDGVEAGAGAPEDGDEPWDRELPPPALETLCRTFGLTPFERRVLLLAAAVELDGAFPDLCARAQGVPERTHPTFDLALAALPEAHWSALAPTAPLRHWQLVELGPGNALTTSPLRIDERVLHYLTGVTTRDERLAGMSEPLASPGELVPSHRRLAELGAASWRETAGGPGFPVLQLVGEEPSDQLAVAAATCELVGLEAWHAPADALPTDAAELHRSVRLWNRETLLAGGALVVDCHSLEEAGEGGGEGHRQGAVARVVERLGCPVIVASRQRRRPLRRPLLSFDLDRPQPEEQRRLWHRVLEEGFGPLGEEATGPVDRLVGQFHLSAPSIRAAAASVLGELSGSATSGGEGGGGEDGGGAEPDAERLGRALWHSCRLQARPRLEDLAQRIDARAGWEDLVLPAPQRLVLGEVLTHVRERSRVLERWGFTERGSRGLGLAVLFAGVSGTGKTMAAEVLAREVDLDLFRIDLSSVVSKYIGETEKNLGRVFHAAEAGGAILLFDEADALFGRRTEVKDSHDRYANLEVSYLLQRMESYRGLAILTTNLKEAVDKAFLRRFRFIVDFPFPDARARAEIWRRVFPEQTPTEGLDPRRLARLNVTGGNIRNIALNAAFLAAGAGEPVRMEHLLKAARREYDKMDQHLSDAEVEDWR